MNMKKQSIFTETILIVDDKPETLSVLSKILLDQGFNVRAALNVDIAMKSATKYIPNLILMDVNMPGTDGFEACRQIKKIKTLESVPVIFLTGKTDTTAKITGFKAGGVDYITKPFVNEEVIARIKTHLSIKQERERFYALAEATTEGIIIHDNDVIVDVNSAFETIMKYKRSNIINEHLQTIFSSKTLQTLSKSQKNQYNVCEIQDKRSDGSSIMAELRVKFIQYQGVELNIIALRDITETQHLKRENASFITSISRAKHLGNMVGKSKIIQKVYERILHFAASDETVMIYGETGTGKELAAKNIHQMSQRSEKPFVIANCAAIPDKLFESIFFGYIKGSFTNAFSDNMGLFEQANGGILLLDEIGELKKNSQAKLLRVIETGEYIPIGGNIKHANVRIISTTNIDLKQMVNKGKMREDFFHRLNVLCLTLPPLRERIEDIPLLVNHFIEMNQSLNVNNKVINDQVIVKLQEYQWPGNVRELFNELRRYYSTGELDNVDYVSSPLDSLNLNFFKGLTESLSLSNAVSEFEKYYINHILALHNGKKNKTAKTLEIDPRTLYNKLNRFKQNS
ncbi:Acetoacetate metabolism regulatory protein atoC [Candidatus Magnetomorum sp. HK-1]|nr:Acetoacetate metabolism regulatory protein atoC [Candidatus Magnetomorum sp. HK-1]